jgi:hypothetical protein
VPLLEQFPRLFELRDTHIYLYGPQILFADCSFWNIIFILTEIRSSCGKQNFRELNMLLLMNPRFMFQENNESAYFTIYGLVCVA